jgi:hypothetical protein
MTARIYTYCAIVGEQRQNEFLKARTLSALRVTANAVPPHGKSKPAGFRLSARTVRKVAKQSTYVRGGRREKRVRCTDKPGAQT